MTKDKTKHNCSNCSAFGKHCPHKVNGDPYYYDCGMTLEELEKENAELKADNDARKFAMAMSEKVEKQLRKENAELKAQLENDRDLPAIAYMQGAEKQKKKDEEQLTKAKETLKGLYFIIESRIDYKNNIEIADEMWRAKQFWSVEK